MILSNYKIKDWDGVSMIKIIEIGSVKIVLLKVDLTVAPPKEGRKNLLGIDKDNNVIWIANLPDKGLYSSYDDINFSNNILLAWCGSYLCEINPINGSLLSQKFIK